MTGMPLASYYKEILIRIYPCKIPFTLRVLHTRPKSYLGTYAYKTHAITIYDKGRFAHMCVKTAIHEYAHHLHVTEFGRDEKKQAVHSPEFWQIYGQLMWRARVLGLQPYNLSPVLDFESVGEN